MGMASGDVKKFDVFVTPLMEGNLTKKDDLYTDDQFKLDHAKSIIEQLIDGLIQLTVAEKSHNDLKPSNLLYKRIYDSPRMTEQMDGWDVEIKISDFGTCERRGGTPGWTAPQFIKKRKPGRSDMYSVGLVILYILVKDDPESMTLFYCLRDNYIDDSSRQWLKDFRNMPLIKFVMRLMDLEDQPTVYQCKEEWKQMNKKIDFISRECLCAVPRPLLKLQYKHNADEKSINMIEILEE